MTLLFSCLFRISFTDLIHGILKNQEIVKIIGIILLRNASHSLPNLEHIMTTTDCEEYLSQRLKQSTIDHFLSILLKTYLQMHLFDSRPGLKVLFKKISRLKCPANLYKQSSLCLSIAFVVQFNLVLNNLESNLFFQDNFKQLFIMICEHYADFIASNCTNNRLDDIYSAPIFILPETFLQNDHAETETESKSPVEPKEEIDKPDKSNGTENDLDGTKTYFIIREKQIDDLKKAYRKWKYQHSPLPPSFNQTLVKKNLSPRRYSITNSSSNASSTDDSYQLQDCEGYLSLWTPIIMSMVESHLSLPNSVFQKLIEYFEPGIELLVMYSQSRDLRSLLALWLRRCLTTEQAFDADL